MNCKDLVKQLKLTLLCRLDKTEYYTKIPINYINKTYIVKETH